jgi:glutamate formiminotransferase/glutamate formiminotransferase/formiminotetrahydrofolate cyclodeaminase
MTSPILLVVPNVSEGRDAALIERIGVAFTGSAHGTASGAQATGGQTTQDARAGQDVEDTPEPAGTQTRLLDVHSDADHHRSVFTLAGRAPQLADSLVRGAAAAIGAIDVVKRAAGPRADAGAHPHVGAIDVVPLVYFDSRARGAACAEALVVGERIGSELGVPVFLYGELAGDTPGRTRAELRRGGIAGLTARMSAASASERQAGEPLRPDFGPPEPHPSAGATLLAAREPLVAFNLQLLPPATLQDARRVAAQIREGGEHGLPGLRAIGVALSGDVAQVSMNVERPLELPLGELVRAVAKLAPVASAELVGLAPRAAFDGFPAELPLPGFDPERHLIESALGL